MKAPKVSEEDLFPMDVRGLRRPVNRVSQVLVLLLAIALVLLVACATRDHGRRERDHVTIGDAPGVGAAAPDFTLADAHGGTFTLSKATAKGPVLIVFYLGYECPHCVHNLRDLANHAAEFAKSHTQIVAISPDSVEMDRQSAHDFGDFPFPLLSDPDKKVAAAYGVLLGDNVMFHGAYIVDTRGNIRFAIRSDHPYDNVEALLRVLKDAGRQAETTPRASTNP